MRVQTMPYQEISAKKVKQKKNYENLHGYTFVAPMMIGLLIFTVIPTIISLLLSFTEWSFISGIDKIKFVGVKNYAMLLDDQVFLESLMNNLKLLVVVPVQMVLALLLAVIIDKFVYFKNVMKVIFFMPYISSIVAVAIVFQLLFHPSYGPINQFLRGIGITDPPKWLADIHYALPSVMIIMVWVGVGFCMIIYMAALQAIPKELYESAELDGAGAVRKFKSITFPLVSPTTFFLLVTGLISSFKSFDIIKVLTNGGPSESTSVVTLYLYSTAFESLKTGYASSMAWVLFGCVLLITVVQIYGQKKWVNY
ncbi:carbohydrate ABC transporter permease [Paenibacillus roseipurpureus]|uniref:Sugar ABC transporter permease n=1 Tax=Paenibacillus roseopurpureus TaxID=2918901 RepID=A0AA96LNM9_9BACL|nr:sugar ABC transporter permease [Paenibacillus sp. MBLB1832]WNR43048.1 sugar ABC transporter permease [Paenibacillus sp. MBLB1832]